MTQRKHSREQWQQLINEQVDSGLSVAAFCRKTQLSVSSFYQWRKKFDAVEPELNDWLALPGAASAPADDWQIELALPGGVVLRMSSAV